MTTETDFTVADYRHRRALHQLQQLRLAANPTASHRRRMERAAIMQSAGTVAEQIAKAKAAIPAAEQAVEEASEACRRASLACLNERYQ